MTNTVYDIITDKVCTMLDKGIVPWHQPWKGGDAPRNLSGSQYRGLNIWLLEATRQDHAYKSNVWMTFKQANGLGAHVRKGEHGTAVIFWKMLETKDKDGEKDTFPLLRYFTVFNADQVDGYTPPTTEEGSEFAPILEAENIAANMQNAPRIVNGGRASYSPISDAVTIPPCNDFEDAGSYYSTLFHELTHSTGHASRLGRFSENDTHHPHLKDEIYSKEELIAEMGAAYLCGTANITGTFDNSAAYIASWLQALKNNRTLLVKAASAAQKAADYILNKQTIPA